MDHREAILVRLLAVASEIEGVVRAYRNKDDVPETSRPCIVILDADEVAEEGDPRLRSGAAPRRVSMTPEIYIMLGAEPKDVGTEINLLRARFIQAVCGDAALAALTHDMRGVRYEGCATGLARGRTMEGEMGVSFSFSYVMRPEALV